MHRLTIIYGTPTDPDEFDRYYREIHLPLARAMRNLTGWNLSWLDPDAEAASGFHLVADLYADSDEAMAQILASPEGVAANKDLDNFVSGSVQFLGGTEEKVPLT